MTSSDTTAGHAPAYRFDADRSLISYVAEIARIQPDAPALLLADRVVSYGELLDRADVYAAAFQDKGAGPGGFVGLLVSRSFDCIAGMLGALRIGAGYVPLDPSYASESQLGNITRQLPFAAVLVDPVYSEISDRLIDAAVVLPVIGDGATDPGPKRHWPEVNGSDPAYLVFTSGTTGQPKGVILANRGLASFSLDQTVFRLGRDDIMMHATSMACDGGLLEVWPARLNGAALAIVDGTKPTLQDMANTITRHKDTVTFQYIGMHQLLVDHHLDAFKTLRLALTGGDIMAPDHARRLKAA
ncbi:MAG: non-ribosomal peptide synthetase component F [Paracoccaceae bacterium]|jgi:non-ribosomal peptide synthetase component F